MSKTTGALVLIVASALASSAIASPPPPPPSFVDGVAKQLVQTQSPASFARYANMLANDLTVTLDVKMIAASKPEWLTIEKPGLGTIDRSVYEYAEGGDNTLVLMTARAKVAAQAKALNRPALQKCTGPQ